MQISLIVVGKLKERFLRDAEEEYRKRLSSYCRLEIIELADEPTIENASMAQEAQIKGKEGARILKSLPEGAYTIALAIEGKPLSSEGFSEKLGGLALAGDSKLAFVIGGSTGLSQDVLKRADFSLSLSKMTFPHQLTRVLLLEQIYRAFRILRHEPYHK
ncbi:MAG: 23S rRNA (pseudouridine(1915)-N(3))-methyltransferase RlmH [Bacteroidota bacterium]